MPTIDIDRDAAQEAAERELAKAMYSGPSLTERFANWLDQLLYRIALEGSSVPGGWFTLSVLLILLVVATLVTVRVAARTMRTSRGDRMLFDSDELTAAGHRGTAQQYAAVGEWGPAIRHRLRAVARQLEETGVLTSVPGRTATELARDTAPALPALSAEIAGAADVFNDVTYGERPGTESAYRVIADLDDRLRSHAHAPATSAPAPADNAWAELR